ncbi:hypothetical protein [Azospirillum canadense]|uniref:hypothetical protein n=1 Tax=Azospirillum canadense TaxID=403962 RepID=UPI002225FC5B|nr:hypothetical protein [Azospirillum canadense]MCW2242533.1 hypothetical protein [Azospirillum canadense]
MVFQLQNGDDATATVSPDTPAERPQPLRPDALRRVLDQTDAKTPFQQTFLLVGALDKVAEGADEAWAAFARDIATHLLLAPPRALVGGAEPGPAHADARAIIERIAKGEPIDPTGARDRVFAAIVEAHRNARDRAEAITVREEADRRRLLDLMQDRLPIAIVAAIAVTAEMIKGLLATGSAPADRVAALDDGLEAGLQAMTAKGIQPSDALQALIAACRTQAAAGLGGTGVGGGRGGGLAR